VEEFASARRRVGVNPALSHQVSQQRHLDAIREARRHALASVPPKERRPPQHRSPLLVALRPLLGR
jgi:hypothetical protein